MVQFIFFDKNPKLLQAYSQSLSYLPKECRNKVRILKGACDVRELEGVDVFVSTADSYGYLDTGIDVIYSKMFPGIGEIVRSKIKERSPTTTAYGRGILCVGSAILVKCSKDKQLIVAPITPSPRIIKNPENIYYAMYAILEVSCSLPKDSVIAIPGIGAGTAKIPYEESAKMISRAFRDFFEEIKVAYPAAVSVNHNIELGSYVISPAFLE